MRRTLISMRLIAVLLVLSSLSLIATATEKIPTLTTRKLLPHVGKTSESTSSNTDTGTSTGNSTGTDTGTSGGGGSTVSTSSSGSGSSSTSGNEVLDGGDRSSTTASSDFDSSAFNYSPDRPIYRLNQKITGIMMVGIAGMGGVLAVVSMKANDLPLPRPVFDDEQNDLYHV